MLVKVKINDILHQTHKATLFLIGEKEIWLPNVLFKFSDGNNIIISDKIAEEKFIFKYKKFIHIPEKFKINKKQEPIKELKC